MQEDHTKRVSWKNPGIWIAIIAFFSSLLVALINGWFSQIGNTAKPYQYQIQLTSQDGTVIDWKEPNPRIRIFYANSDPSFPISGSTATIELTKPIGDNPVRLELVNGVPYDLCVENHRLTEEQATYVNLCVSGQQKPGGSITTPSLPPGAPMKQNGETDILHKPVETPTQSPSVTNSPQKAFVAVACREAYRLEIDGQPVPLQSGNIGFLTFNTTPGTHTLSVWDQFNKPLMENVSVSIPPDSIRISRCGPQPVIQTLKSYRQNFQ